MLVSITVVGKATGLAGDGCGGRAVAAALLGIAGLFGTTEGAGAGSFFLYIADATAAISNKAEPSNPMRVSVQEDCFCGEEFCEAMIAMSFFVSNSGLAMKSIKLHLPKRPPRLFLGRVSIAAVLRPGKTVVGKCEKLRCFSLLFQLLD